MADILKTILGEKLALPLPEGSPLPSPEALRGKIIVKGKTLTGSAADQEDEGDQIMEEEEEAEKVNFSFFFSLSISFSLP